MIRITDENRDVNHRHLVLIGASGDRRNIRLALRHCLQHFIQQPVAVMAGNLNIDAVVGFHAAFPLNLDHPCRFFPVTVGWNIRTILTVYGYAAPAGYVTDNIVARHGVATSCEADKQIINSFDTDAVGRLVTLLAAGFDLLHL
ncbi:hypothetical protein D3C86_1807550 [compost metagenome]